MQYANDANDYFPATDFNHAPNAADVICWWCEVPLRYTWAGLLADISINNRQACRCESDCGLGVRVLQGLISLANKHRAGKIERACETALRRDVSVCVC